MELKHKNSLNQRPLKPNTGTRLYSRVIPNKASENLGDLFLEAIASLVVTFSLTHSVSHSLTHSVTHIFLKQTAYQILSVLY